MPETGLSLPIVDAEELSDRVRAVLQPGATLTDRAGIEHALPRFFYEIDSWKTALETKVTPNFMLWEFVAIDVREAEPLRHFPRYVPCAVTALAAHLEVFRDAVNTYVHIAANGGYRSPGHALTRYASRHCWASAANIYRVGDEWLHDPAILQKYTRIARDVLPFAWLRPLGSGDGFADDHLHMDFGYLRLEPVSDSPDMAPAKESARHARA